jgi:hypothetical protein
MQDFFFEFHSGWRFLVLLAMVVNFLYFGFVLATRAKTAKRDRIISLIFAISADVQITLGIVLLLIFIANGDFSAGTHLGHLVPMLLVAPIAHAYTLYGRLAKSASQRQQRVVGLLAPVVALVLILGGLASLDGIGLFTMSSA